MKWYHYLSIVFLIVSIAFIVVYRLPKEEVTVKQSDDSFDIQEHDGVVNNIDSNLCKTDEDIVFSFKESNSDRVITVAHSQEQDYLVIRVGTSNNLDVEFPKEKADSWSKFKYDSYMRGGGSENLGMHYDSLSFEMDSLKYILYYEYAAATNKYSVGLLVIDNETIETIYDIQGDLESIIGNLGYLLDTDVQKGY